MTPLSRGLLFALLLLGGVPARTQGAGMASLDALADDPGWRRLVHYQRALTSPSGWRSAIHSPEFFLAAEGDANPLAELRATVAAFRADPPGNPDEHARCRFPARYRWLVARLGEGAAPAAASGLACPAFEKWTRSATVESVSVVFATGYLGNPASYYGHTLLKFNFHGDQGASRLLDVCVNYGAILAQHDDPVTYLAKSLAGGYDGGFSHIQFYYLNHNYGENELRDLWEYRLDLPQPAVDQIVAHAWEVLGRRYTYYFFRENCAYRMAELLEVADGVEVMPDHWPWIVPQALVQSLGSAKFEGRPLLGAVRYFPSRQSRFYEKYRALPDGLRPMVADVTEGRRTLEDPAIIQRPTEQKQLLLDALLDYYQYIGTPLEKADRGVREGYAAALAARYQLAPGVPEPPAPPPTAPHLGRPPGWVQAGWLHNSASGAAVFLHVRPAYYDPLDAGPGEVANAYLVMGDTQIDARRGRTYLRRLDLIGVDSANPGVSGLPGDSTAAWKVHLGAEQDRLACDDCLVGRLQGDMGVGRQWTAGLYSAAYVGGAVQAGHDAGSRSFVRATADLIAHAGEAWSARLSYEQRLPLAARHASYGVARAESRWPLGARSDLRMSFQHDGARVIGIGAGYYW